MKVEIIEPKGYCSGVTNAIKIALKAKEEHPNKDVFVLGMLVHNEQVINFLEEQGIKVVYNINEDIVKYASFMPDESVIVFTAHGHDSRLDRLAESKKMVVYDAICPKVKQNIEIIRNNLKMGHQVIYIGIPNHPEAVASLSIGKNVFLYDAKQPFDFKQISDDSPLVVNQTTLNFLDLKDVHKNILNVFPNARINNEICAATRTRQQAVINLSDDVDLIIVVGDKKSSNCNRLLEIAKTSHPNVPSYLVSGPNDFDTRILINKNHVAISSGASTPLESINAIYDLIKNY